MAGATLDRLPNGKWRVAREFESLAAATAAVGKLAEVNEAAFQPHKPIIASVPRVPHAIAAAAQRDLPDPTNHHAIEAPMPAFDTLQDEEPPLRACPAGGCGED